MTPSPVSTSAASRREFLRRTTTFSAGLTLAGGPLLLRGAESPAEKIVVGVMGLGRGMDHVKALLQIPNTEIAWLCDVDETRLARAARTVAGAQTRSAREVKDVRTVLDDPAVDALFIAAPNHWHAPATILACAAGKHVYVEKPASHNAREGEWMVEAARRHRRVVQMGNQRRSWPAIREAMEKLRGGVIGPLRFARCWYTNARGSIGRGKEAPAPPHFDYTLWQGPAPERPYRDNLVHYHWHWRWHWGGGELANNGIHALDLARWGLGVDYPRRVTFNGGRYHFDDDQETPDTGAAVFDFGTTGVTWDNSSCVPRAGENLAFVTFYGDHGSLACAGGGTYKVFDPKGKEIGQGSGPAGERDHFEDFFACIRSGRRPRADAAECQKSTLLCHLGNIAYRTGHALNIAPATGRVLNDPDASALWGREYRPGWEPKV
jgi:predicted dehydrogenase